MKIYLFRHAEKINAFHRNPELSPQGEKQALLLAEKVQQALLPRPTELWVSPKKRAQQSMGPLSQALDLPLQIKTALDERDVSENQSQFHQRVEKICHSLTSAKGVIYLCSHFDWLEEALAVLPSDEELTHERYAHWSPLQYMGFHFRDSLFQLIDSQRIS